VRRVLSFVLFVTTACEGDKDLVDAITPTWETDVGPILQGRCAFCHADGAIAPFPLGTYEEAAPYADLIADAVTSRIMPPWGADPDCNEYAYDVSLSDEQIATIALWAEGGAPRGDPAEAGPADAFTPASLARVDVEVQVPEPYTPLGAPDDYRCFVLDWPESEEVYVTGFEVLPDQRSIVHHVLLYAFPPDLVYLADDADAADPDVGYPCYGGPGGDTLSALDYDAIATLGAWAPGYGAGSFVEGTGLPVEPGSKLVLQMHYNTASAAPVADQSSVALQIDAEVEHPSRIRAFTNPDWLGTEEMRIPAGGEDVNHAFSYAWPASIEVLGASLHMHQLGQSARLSVTHADGEEECILGVDPWDFHWQLMYQLASPVTIVEGDTLNLSCTFDNLGDADVFFGEGTSDEMCLGFLYAHLTE